MINIHFEFKIFCQGEMYKLKQNIALIVVDMQTEFFMKEDSQTSMNRSIEYVNYVIDMFRKANRPIIFVADEEAGEGIGSEGYQLYPDLNFTSNDVLISKSFSNSFWNTKLDNILREQNVELVVICGFAAEYCVYATYNGAMERGYKALILQNGIASTNTKYVNMIETISNTISYPALEFMLDS